MELPLLKIVEEKGTLDLNYVAGATFSRTPSSRLGSLRVMHTLVEFTFTAYI